MARKDRKKRRQRFVKNRDRDLPNVHYPPFYKQIVKYFPVAVDPRKRIIYNYDGAVMLRVARSTYNFGYCCPKCGIAGADIWHFWISETEAICTDCARKQLIWTDDNLASI